MNTSFKSLQIKRAYDPISPKDGVRILVDRLWPRGIKKETARIKLWAKELTPSSELRKWFHADPEKHFTEFQKKYQAELTKNKSAVSSILAPFANKKVTLVTGVKDIEHSHIPTLKSFIDHQ